MLLGDFHIHTTWSDGRHSLPEVVDVFGRTGHDVIAITDHERIDAAVAARAIAVDRGLPFEVIVGEEVTAIGLERIRQVPYATTLGDATALAADLLHPAAHGHAAIGAQLARAFEAFGPFARACRD